MPPPGLAGVPLVGRERELEAIDARPGDVTILPTRHDAWVVGDEPVVVIDWSGATNYAAR